MKIPNITGLMKVGKTFIMANRPEILFGASVTATVVSVGLAAKGGYEARGIVDRAESVRANNIVDGAVVPQPPLTTKEKVKLTWLCYMPAMVTTVSAVGATTGLHIVHVKDKKMMAQAALAAIEEVKTSAKEFEKESLGVLSNDEKDRILTDRANNTPIIEEGVAHVQGRDGVITPMYLCRDALTGRDFWASETKVENAINELNHILNTRGDADLNTFYVWAGFPELQDGEELGWSGQFVSLKWKDGHREDGQPLREFTFQPPPTKGYDSPHA